MKHFSLTTGIAGVLLASCTFQEVDTQEASTEETVYFASFEQPGDKATKVYADDNLMVLWDADDRVSIFNKNTANQEYRFTGKTGDNAGSFRKVGGANGGSSLDLVYSVYPYKEENSIDKNGALSLTLPATQAYREDSFGIGANTMVSCTTGNQLLFKNVCGYLMLRLYGDDVTVKSISIKGNNDERLAGAATVIASVNTTPTLSFGSEASHEITLSFDSPVKIGMTENTATTFWLVIPPTTFSKGFTLTVKDDKNGVFEKTTSSSFKVERNSLARMAALFVEPDDGHRFVDLGLPSGIKWADRNIGADSPEEYGLFFGWGETSPKTTAGPSKYHYEGDLDKLIKYIVYPKYAWNGEADYLTTLLREDDAATIIWGEKWRMPTYSDLKELATNCKWTWETVQNTEGEDINGYRIEGNNGNSIFIPAAGHTMWSKVIIKIGTEGGMWTSSLYETNDLYAHGLHFTDSRVNYSGTIGRGDLLTIRPVYVDINSTIDATGIAIDKSSLTIPVDRTKKLTATVSPENAANKYVIWSSSDTSIASVSDGSVTGIGTGNCVITAKTVNGLSASCNVSVVPKSDPSFYSSTDYSKDGEVVLLHEATVGNGVNLILIGEGYVDKDMGEGGKYDQKMIKAMEQFFSYEPYKSLKDRFNVYYVRVVSTNDVFWSEQSDRKLSYELDGLIYFRKSLCYDYAKIVPNPNNQPIKLAVLFNIDTQFARSFCEMELSSRRACCYILGTEENLINHELGGHGFAFLADEYSENSGSFTQQSKLDQYYESYSYGANVDYNNDPATIRWSRLLNDTRYAAEKVGIYEGAYLYPRGIYRSSQNSVMRVHYDKTGKAFNAPCREQIYKTVMKYSEGKDWTYDYESFVQADAAGREQAAKVFYPSSSSTASVRRAQQLYKDSHIPPVIVDKEVKEIAVDKDGNVILIE